VRALGFVAFGTFVALLEPLDLLQVIARLGQQMLTTGGVRDWRLDADRPQSGPVTRSIESSGVGRLEQARGRACNNHKRKSNSQESPGSSRHHANDHRAISWCHEEILPM
jgi:hypothetical protein